MQYIGWIFKWCLECNITRNVPESKKTWQQSDMCPNLHLSKSKIQLLMYNLQGATYSYDDLVLDK